jgi:hypothetical protein
MKPETIRCLYCKKLQTIPAGVQECLRCGAELIKSSPSVSNSYDVSYSCSASPSPPEGPY